VTAAISGTTPAAGTSPTQQRDALKKAAQQFEAIFLRQLLSSARSASLADDDVFGSDATEQFRDMADSRTADSMSQKGIFGVADMLVSQFKARIAPGATNAATAAGGAK
jgi:flagellar protein FlgJ